MPSERSREEHAQSQDLLTILAITLTAYGAAYSGPAGRDPRFLCGAGFRLGALDRRQRESIAKHRGKSYDMEGSALRRAAE